MSKSESYYNCVKCKTTSRLVLGMPEGRSVETADTYRNVKQVSDVKNLIDERASQYWREHDLPRLIADKGLEYCKQNGFVDQDGRPKK